MSVLLHGLIIGAFAYAWWRYEYRPVTKSVAVDATVVDARALNGMGAAHQAISRPQAPPQRPVPTPPQVAPPQGPPAPTSAQALALRAKAAEAEARRVAAAAAERRRLRRQQQAAARAAALAKAQAEARARARAARLARLQRARERAEKLAEQRQLALQRKLAAERAAAARAARIAQLRQALAQSAQSSAKMRAAVAGWINEVTQRVETAWIRPPSARQNINCTVHVTLVQGGAVASASVGRCNGDEAVRESIEAAVYRASPLPPPPDPALYNQELDFIFAPQ